MVGTKISGNRYEELRRILQERRHEIMSEVIDRMRDVRTEGNGAVMQGVLDDVETSEADIQGEIEFALIQMKAETLAQIDEALARLEQEAYGYCFECSGEISEQRLRRFRLRFDVKTAKSYTRGPSGVVRRSPNVTVNSR